MKCKKFVACLFIFLTSCATQYSVPRAGNPFASYLYGDLDHFKIDMSAPLGSVSDSEAKPKKYGLAQYGLACDAQLSVFSKSVKVKQAGLIFSSKKKKIVWYGLFNAKGSMLNNFGRTFWIRWISSDGRVYHQKEFKTKMGYPNFAKTELEFPEPFDALFYGRWRVQVGKKKTLIDDRYFEIIKTEKTQEAA